MYKAISCFHVYYVVNYNCILLCAIIVIRNVHTQCNTQCTMECEIYHYRYSRINVIGATDLELYLQSKHFYISCNIFNNLIKKSRVSSTYWCISALSAATFLYSVFFLECCVEKSRLFNHILSSSPKNGNKKYTI